MASADLAVIKYVPEVTLGTTPAAALTKVNVTNFNVNPQISTTTSTQISSTRSDIDLIQTSGKTSGDMGVEWQYAAYDAFLESALGGTFSTAVAYTATTISAANADNSFNDSGAGFSTANILPGHWIKVSGFTGGNIANNHKPCQVVSVTTSKIVVAGITLVDDAAGESVKVVSHSLRNGTTKKSFTLEVENTDLTTTFQAYKGMVVNTASINATTGSIVNGSIGFEGLTTTYGTTTVGTGAEVAATSNTVFNPTTSIGTIYVDGTALSGVCVKTVNLSTTNNTRDSQCLGSLYPSNIQLGTLGVTGTINAYFSSTTLLNKFINGTAISLEYGFQDSSYNTFWVELPNVKFNTGALSGLSKNSDIMVDLTFTALYSSASGYTIQISSLAA